MQSLIKHTAVTCLAIVLVACATVGRDFDRTHVNDIKKGAHDKAQIRAWFGVPHQVTTASGNEKGCNETWMYQYARATHAGRKSSGAALAVVFDTNGKVCESAYSEVGK